MIERSGRGVEGVLQARDEGQPWIVAALFDGGDGGGRDAESGGEFVLVQFELAAADRDGGTDTAQRPLARGAGVSLRLRARAHAARSVLVIVPSMRQIQAPGAARIGQPWHSGTSSGVIREAGSMARWWCSQGRSMSPSW